MSLHNEQRHEKMAQEGRKKTINDVLDVMKQVFEKTSRHNGQQQGRKQVFKKTSRHNKQQQGRKQVFEKTRRHNEWQQGRKQVFENVREDNEQGGL